MRALRKSWDRQVLGDALALDEPDEARWSEHLLSAARAVFEAPVVGLQWRTQGPRAVRDYRAPRLLGPTSTDAPAAQDAALLEALHAPGAPLASVAELLGRAGLPAGLLHDQLGWTDAMTARATQGDLSVLLYWATPEGALEHSQRDVAQLRRVARQLEGALRLREATEVLGVLDGSGGWLEQGRAAASVWDELLGGHVSVVPQDRGGVRRFALLANAPERRSTFALLAKEAAACERLAAGEQSKAVAGALLVSPSRLSRLLASAAGKLGFHTPFEALGVLGGLLALREPHGAASLSMTEREVLRLVQRGLSNRDIAILRGRSERTVANQVASLLRKTGLGGRRALAARALLQEGPEEEDPPGRGGG